MTVDCGGVTKQTARENFDGPLFAGRHGIDAAQQQAKESCAKLQCTAGKCFYVETQLVGSTFYDSKTKKWISDQTSSGKCTCSEERPASCKKEVQQTVTYSDDNEKRAGNQARALAREIADFACESGHCPKPSTVTKLTRCIYVETSMDGTTWFDSTSGKWLSKQTTTGKCRCDRVWL